jgi:hypothetical protein
VTAELTLWPDGWRYRLPVAGNVVLARVSVRQRTERVTYAVEECAWTSMRARPSLDPVRFKVRTRRRVPEPASRQAMAAA